MADLHLNLKGEYFNQIKSGDKKFEFRLYEKWAKKLEGKTFDRIWVKHGYPRADDSQKIICRPWLGYEIHTITHPLFGAEPVKVFAIHVN